MYAQPLLRKRISLPKTALAILAVAAILLSVACGEAPVPTTTSSMGAAIKLGNVEHTVLGAGWRTTLGEGTAEITPTHQFLVVKLALSNLSDSPAAIASINLISNDGTEYDEVADAATSWPDWLGLVRTLSAKENRQGDLVFDAPRGAYKLKLTERSADGDDVRAVLVEIPVRLDEGLPTDVDPTKSRSTFP